MKTFWELCKTYLHPVFLVKFFWGMLFNNASYLTVSTLGIAVWLAYKGENYPASFWFAMCGVAAFFAVLWAVGVFGDRKKEQL